MNEIINVGSNDFLKNLLSGNRQKCTAITNEFLTKNPSIKDLYEGIFKEALYEVGRLWETNKITVASEHLATAITEGILNELYQKLTIAEQKETSKVVLTCVENEMHQVGIKMVTDIFEMNGWDTYFLGTGIPVNELVTYIQVINPHVLAISLSIYFNFQNLIKMLNTLKEEFPELTIVLGGQAFKQILEDNSLKMNGVFILPNLYELETFIKNFKS